MAVRAAIQSGGQLDENHVLARFTRKRIERIRWGQSFAAILQAAMIEPRRFEVTNHRVSISKLPREFHGFRIAQLSDIHHSPFLSEDEISAAVRKTNELEPDLVVLTGDYISHSTEYISGCARVPGGLNARHGVYAILGNHDHWTDGEMMSSALSFNGIKVLNNENVRIELQDSYIRLAGIDDLMVRRGATLTLLLRVLTKARPEYFSHITRELSEKPREQESISFFQATLTVDRSTGVWSQDVKRESPTAG